MDLFESLPDFRKNVFMMFSLKEDDKIWNESVFFINDNKRLFKDFQKIVSEKMKTILVLKKTKKNEFLKNFLINESEKHSLGSANIVNGELV